MLSDDRPHIGQNIRRVRLAAKITQEQLAALIGMTQSQMSRLELAPNPRDATIRRVADALHVPFEELKPPPPPRTPKKPWPPKGLRWIRIVMPLDVKLRSTTYLGTPAALKEISDAGQKPPHFLDRNAIGDWGDVTEEQAAANNRALVDDSAVKSVYHTRIDAILWILTDAVNDFGERDNTRILLPEEYKP